MSKRLRILIVGHLISGEATGEGFVAFKITEALSKIADVTLATLQSPHHTLLSEQLPNVEVVTFPQPQALLHPRQFRERVKPELLVFSRYLRRFLARDGHRFDIGHQLMPASPRHISPLYGTGVPYVLGPFGGSLPTPPGFREETAASEPWFARLRALDGLRLRYDPRLRASHSNAIMILGVAPYMRDILDAARLPIHHYANYMKLGIEEIPPAAPVRSRASEDPLKLLHIGRGVRTKGLRDTIRALALLKDDSRFTLESAGGGSEIEICKAEAAKLGVADRVVFHDRVPRSDVEKLYERADVFSFPSFREPAGAVFFEAMRWGLPVVTARAGGADAIVDESCGIKVDVIDSEQFSSGIAAALKKIADDPALYVSLSTGARKRVADALWPNRAAELLELYYAALNASEKRDAS